MASPQVSLFGLQAAALSLGPLLASSLCAGTPGVSLSYKDTSHTELGAPPFDLI